MDDAIQYGSADWILMYEDQGLLWVPPHVRHQAERNARELGVRAAEYLAHTVMLNMRLFEQPEYRHMLEGWIEQSGSEIIKVESSEDLEWKRQQQGWRTDFVWQRQHYSVDVRSNPEGERWFWVLCERDQGGNPVGGVVWSENHMKGEFLTPHIAMRSVGHYIDQHIIKEGTWQTERA